MFSKLFSHLIWPKFFLTFIHHMASKVAGFRSWRMGPPFLGRTHPSGRPGGTRFHCNDPRCCPASRTFLRVTEGVQTHLLPPDPAEGATYRAPLILQGSHTPPSPRSRKGGRPAWINGSIRRSTDDTAPGNPDGAFTSLTQSSPTNAARETYESLCVPSTHF